ncbi:LOG family protein [Pseudomonas seleniipraecipitans]|uniref:AMP nucleosidase n=1 Tax=Phytopseudomonas seleniipraecipitans TaxID=640205 RepID=A0ABY5J764_9GAMM|nr:LOG family protein [Pseudomonas seleniipraecipitans]NQD79011.1 LOG family protein [Pseudomonas sp. CrR14]UUD63485.1 LOG family protein [Pseudomonas seleniipraecipitans]
MDDHANAHLSRHPHSTSTHLADSLDELAAQITPADSPNLALYREMLATVARMAQADRNRWDAKIMLQTLREMERAFSVLDRFRHRRKVTVFGSARTQPGHPVYALARDLGATLARYDLMAITGAGGGIMAAVHEGAGLDHSLGFNITLPFEQSANATMQGSDNLLSFHFFFLRKLFFVKEADALVLCPGGFGTLDEALEVITLIQTGKSPLVPVILLDEPDGTFWQGLLDYIQQNLDSNGYILASDMNLLHLVHGAEEAAEEIARFYANFHSSRWMKDRFVIRMRHALTNEALSELNQRFSDLCKTGEIQQLSSSEEPEAAELRDLPRLVFTFTGRSAGRLRELLDLINLPQHWQA